MNAPARTIARILGPAALAISVTEWANMDAFATQTPPVVYLNGSILFIAGVAILQAHGRWRRDWSALVTAAGWLLAAAGLYRMVAPTAPQAAAGPATNVVFVLLALAGIVLSVQGYRPPRGP